MWNRYFGMFFYYVVLVNLVNHWSLIFTLLRELPIIIMTGVTSIDGKANPPHFSFSRNITANHHASCSEFQGFSDHGNGKQTFLSGMKLNANEQDDLPCDVY